MKNSPNDLKNEDLVKINTINKSNIKEIKYNSGISFKKTNYGEFPSNISKEW